MAIPSWENLGIFKNDALSKLEVLRQGFNLLDFKHIPKIYRGPLKPFLHSLDFICILY